MASSAAEPFFVDDQRCGAYAQGGNQLFLRVGAAIVRRELETTVERSYQRPRRRGLDRRHVTSTRSRQG